MKILITGICGFAGSIIARGLLEHLPGIQITGIDSLIRKGSETNLEPLRSLGINVRLGDIRHENDLASLPAVDWVLDCAANPSVLAGIDGQTSAKELLDHNLGGTIHLLEYCRKHQAGFILLSTSRVYSIPPLANLKVEVVNHAFSPILGSEDWPQKVQHTQKEDVELANALAPVSGITAPSTLCSPVPLVAKNSLSDFLKLSPSSPRLSTLDSRPTLSPLGLTEQFSTEPPLSLYGSSKRCSEMLALEYGLTFDFPVWINRCGVLAGAGQFGKADQGIFSFWIHSWAHRRPLKYIGFGGMGHQVRDCLHPSDLVELLIHQMNDPSRSVPRIQNLSGGARNSLSLANLSDWCRDRFGGHTVQPDLLPRPFDIPWMVLDSSLANQSWNWAPRENLESILEEICQHTEQNPSWLKMVS